MKPNLFEIATKELSQDGFLTWLIRYADPECQGENPAVFECAQKFVRFLMEKQDDFRIEKVRAYRQWNHIDILVEVNDDSVIIIEDKTVTGTHGNQLQRYRENVEEIFGGKTIYCIYLKTGNESVFRLSQNVEAYGYRVVGRGDILEILNSCKTSNDILTEFRENLQTIEDKTKNCTQIESVCSSSYAAEGFFLELAEQLAANPECGGSPDWGYVSNPKGGFLGLWYFWRQAAEADGNWLYIQIENHFADGLHLYIRMDSREKNAKTVESRHLRHYYGKVSEAASRFGLTVVKRSRFGRGAMGTGTVAEISGIFPQTGKIETDILLSKLKQVRELIESIRK